MENSLPTTYAFDLDGTLCDTMGRDYKSSVPRMKRIEHVNRLKQRGFRIIIFTARGASSGQDFRALTLEQLTQWGLSFDELVLGKPHFDLLVDDKVINEADYSWDD